MKSWEADTHMKIVEIEDETNTIESRIENFNRNGGSKSGAKKS